MIVKLQNSSYFFKFYCQAHISYPGSGIVAVISPTLSRGESYNFNFSDSTLIVELLFRMTYGSRQLSFDNTPVSKRSISYALFGGPVWPLLIINHSIATA